MVSEEEIVEQGLTAEDVLDRETERPQMTVKWLPEWEGHPETQPGENTRIEDEVLIWERDGFEVCLESYETTHWRAVITIPEDVAKWYPRELDLKCRPLPEYGFVESVTLDGYCANEATLIIQENYQPTWEVNKWIDHLLEDTANNEQFKEELTGKLDLARQNGD